MVSAMRKMIWGDGGDGSAAAAADGAPAGYSEAMITKDNIVKEGFLWKQSRYLKQWKK